MKRSGEALVTARVRCASRAQQVTDEQTQALAEAIEARKREVRGGRHGGQAGTACDGGGEGARRSAPYRARPQLRLPCFLCFYEHRKE